MSLSRIVEELTDQIQFERQSIIEELYLQGAFRLFLVSGVGHGPQVI